MPSEDCTDRTYDRGKTSPARPVVWNTLSAVLCACSGAGMLFLCELWYRPFVPSFLFGLHVLFLADYPSAAGVHHSLFCRIAVIREGREKHTELASALAGSFGASLAAGGALVFLAGLYNESFRTAILSIAAFLPLYGMNKVLLSYANGLSLFGTVALGRGIRYSASLAALLLFVALGLDGSLLLLCFAAGETVLFVLLFFTLCTGVSLSDISPAAVRRHLSFGWKIAGSDMLLDWNARAGLFLLPLFVPLQTGPYSIALLVLDGVLQISGAVRIVFSPRILAVFQGGKKGDVRAIVVRAILVSMALSSAAGLTVYAVFYPAGIFSFFQNDIYGGISFYLNIIFPAFVLFAAAYPFMLVLPAAGHPGKFSAILLCVTIVHMIILAFLLPRYGAHGSAASLAVYYVLLSGSLFFAAFKGLKAFRSERGM